MFYSNFEHEKAMNLISSPSPSTYLLSQLSTGLPVPFATSQRQHTTDRSTCCWHQQSVFMSGPQEGLKIWGAGGQIVVRNHRLFITNKIVCNQRLFITNKIEEEGDKQYAIKCLFLLIEGGMSPPNPLVPTALYLGQYQRLLYHTIQYT